MTTTMTMRSELETIETEDLAEVLGGESYGAMCLKGAGIGATIGSALGFKGAAIGAGLGCAVGLGIRAIEGKG